MINTAWKIEETSFIRENVEQNGSRFLIGNGFMGYRGVMEEFSKGQLTALNLAGLFDKNGDKWRESVNAPDPFYARTTVWDRELNPLTLEPRSHSQILDIKNGIHSRKTVFNVAGATVTITAERFLSLCHENLAAMKYTVTTDSEVTVDVETFVDTDVWNINGDHFEVLEKNVAFGITAIELSTLENRIPMRVYEAIIGGENKNTVTLRAGESFTFKKLCGIYWGEVENSLCDFRNLCDKSYEEHLALHRAEWQSVWDKSDVVIEGDGDAQFALRYSIYHLSSIVPRKSGKCSIPARGLSGQVYKGAAFWDTEMFMMPFFSFTDPILCKNLATYRINTLEGAKRKAKEFGFEGAFYAWESQESGDDACTLFNVTDVFTGRPVRTYFKDSQIHISADVIYGLFEYSRVTGDYSLLFEGGLEMMYQCLYFFYSYSVYKPLKERYELHRVIGPDEYHENVNNNAFTSRMVEYCFDAFCKAMQYAKKHDSEFYKEFCETHDTAWIADFREKLYIPSPDKYGVIEQFDGYFALEDISLPDIRKRLVKSNEYWGGTTGIATPTRVIKQADVVMMLNIFRAEYSKEIKRANWEFYEPYTEHGSSLSACAYGIVAAEIGMPDWAYKYFMKTATVDLTGDTKQYAGEIYIGGSHPAANGGSWNTAIFGFAGVSYVDGVLDISPNLPQKWDSMSFNLLWQGVRLSVHIDRQGVKITPFDDASGIKVTVNRKQYKF